MAYYRLGYVFVDRTHNKTEAYMGAPIHLMKLIITGIIPGLFSVSQIQHACAEPLTDLAKKDYRGEPPKQVQIESAYRRCLANVDEEAAAFKPSSAFKKDHVHAETSICDRSRGGCIGTPRSIDCRAFIDDYAE